MELSTNKETAEEKEQRKIEAQKKLQQKTNYLESKKIIKK